MMMMMMMIRIISITTAIIVIIIIIILTQTNKSTNSLDPQKQTPSKTHFVHFQEIICPINVFNFYVV